MSIETATPKDSAALVQYVRSQPYTKSSEYMTKELAQQAFHVGWEF